MRLIILCQETVLAEGLTCLLSECVDEISLEVVGAAEGGEEGLELATRVSPDVAVVALQLKDANGVDVTQRLKDEVKNIEVLILASDPSTEPLREALAAGALGYVTKDVEKDELIRALKSIAEGKTYLSSEAATALVDSTVHGDTDGDPVFSRLSPREREVLQLLAEGLGAKETAQKLCISSKTVDTHRRNIMEKLETDNVADLVKHAIRAGLTTLKT